MLSVIKGYTDPALTVPCCRGEADVFRDKKREIASEGLSQQQLHLILGQRDGRGRRDRQRLRLTDREKA